MFAIFLDIDGVLNTRTTVKRSPDGYTGIDDARVLILAKAFNKYGGGVIILTSDWKDIRKDGKDLIYLHEKLAKYGLSISDKTTDQKHERGAGILKYLSSHPEIDEFVILDDNEFDFLDYTKLRERLLLTTGIENAKFASRTPAIETQLFLDYIKA